MNRQTGQQLWAGISLRPKRTGSTRGQQATAPRRLRVSQASAEAFDDDEPIRQRSAVAHRSVTKPNELAVFVAEAPFPATLADLVRIASCRW
ncbi:hypothetical protein AB0O32_37840 [Streptomyces rubiginosohelvolus]|uniref:hypothetical protein n=1 Tax=Streptomyces rubiginosohelvolus TaxID=67362 RepID=UPI003430643C